ncbi:MAG: crotonase/enoyl-CoA hydratase family protein [Rhodospirillaceae bacterium]|nr:crotonase/enoyl-CoA hydratase family protein [Rhodospirillaceae bacterium]
MTEELKNGINLQVDGEIAFLTIHRPQAHNALDRQSADDFLDAVQTIDTNDAVQAVVLTGTGGRFCAGADLKEMADTDADYHPWAGADGPLAKPCSKPVIAAVEGHAVAGGLGVALWADLRVASETAVFGVFCRRFGVPMSDGTPTRLPAVVGRARALDMLLTGRPVKAEEALRIGLADRLVGAGEALDVATALARDIASFPPLAMRADRAAAWAAFDTDEATRLIEEDRGAQAAKNNEAAAGASRFKDGEGRGGKFSR